MSRHAVWRCACDREVGTIRWQGAASVLKLARAVEDVLIGPGSAAAVCPSCGLPVLFLAREQGFATTMMSA